MKTDSKTCDDSRAAAFNVLIIYDELHSAKCAKELCDRLEQQASSENKLNLKLWSLAALKMPALATTAASDGRFAPLLIVAVHGEAHLPPCVKSWISRWGRAARSFSGGLVVQLHGIIRMNEEVSPAFLCLRHIAHDAGLEFFSEVIEPSTDEPDYSLETIHEHARMKSPLLDGGFLASKGSKLHHQE